MVINNLAESYRTCPNIAKDHNSMLYQTQSPLVVLYIQVTTLVIAIKCILYYHLQLKMVEFMLAYINY